MTRSELAESYFLQGYNCAQSVVLAFVDIVKIDKESALKISSSFGGGIGRLREVCGTVSGIAFVLGAVFGVDNPEDEEGKKNLYKIVQEVVGQFKEKNKTIICRELLEGIESDSSPIPSKRTKEYYKARPCAYFCGYAAEILENYLKEKSVL